MPPTPGPPTGGFGPGKKNGSLGTNAHGRPTAAGYRLNAAVARGSAASPARAAPAAAAEAARNTQTSGVSGFSGLPDPNP